MQMNRDERSGQIVAEGWKLGADFSVNGTESMRCWLELIRSRYRKATFELKG